MYALLSSFFLSFSFSLIFLLSFVASLHLFLLLFSFFSFSFSIVFCLETSSLAAYKDRTVNILIQEYLKAVADLLTKELKDEMIKEAFVETITSKAMIFKVPLFPSFILSSLLSFLFSLFLFPLSFYFFQLFFFSFSGSFSSFLVNSCLFVY